MKGVILLAALAAAASLTSCGDSRSCTADSDCFSGEVCSADDVCVDRPVEITNNGETGNNGQTNNGQTNNGTSAASNNGQTSSNNQTTSNNGSTGGNNTSGTTGQTLECIIDPFDLQCDEDQWEDNDGYDPATSNWDATPWASNSWCDANGDLPESKRTLSGTLCAGDRGDAFRLVVANNGPTCITGNNVLFRMTVNLQTECDPAVFRVEPYTFGRDPLRNDLCNEDENVRCTVSDDGSQHVIEWLWPVDQILDPRIQIMPERDDVQFRYTLDFEIITQ